MSRLPRLGPPGSAVGPLFPKGWDLVVLGGQPIPGRAAVTKAGVKLKHDKKSANGTHGARPTLHGREPQDIDIKITVWTDDQAAILLELLDELLTLPKATTSTTVTPENQLAADLQNKLIDDRYQIDVAAARSSGNPSPPAPERLTAASVTTTSPATAKPLSIDHPSLRAIGITSVFLTGTTALAPTHTRGVLEMTLHLREHRAPDAAPASSVTGTSKDVPNVRAEDAARRNPPPSSLASTTAPPA